MVDHFGALAGFLEPGIDLLIDDLAGQGLFDAVAIILQRDRLAGMRGAGGGLDHRVEVILDVLIGDLYAGAETDFDEEQKSALPEQLIEEILLGDAVIGQGAAESVVARKILFLELLPGGFDIGLGRDGVAAVFQLAADKQLLDHAIGGGAAGGGVEDRLDALLERDHADFAIDVAGGDDAIADRDGDSVDDVGVRHEGQQQNGECGSQSQKVCPMEKKNWKWLTFWTTHE